MQAHTGHSEYESLLKQAGNRTPFQVPENYFEELEKRVMERIAAKNDEAAASLKGMENPLHVPDAYFESFEQRLMKRMEAEPQEREVLAGIEQKNPFVVPEGYFAGSEERIMAHVCALKETPAIRVMALFSSRIAQLAIAASVALLVIFSSININEPAIEQAGLANAQLTLDQIQPEEFDEEMIVTVLESTKPTIKTEGAKHVQAADSLNFEPGLEEYIAGEMDVQEIMEQL